MPTPLDFHRATVLAFKNTLDGRSAKEKELPVSIQIARQFNTIVEEIKKVAPEVASHLPQPVTWKGIAARDMQISDVSFLELQMMLNQVLAVLDVLRGSG